MCNLEKDPLETFIAALLWPLVLLFLGVAMMAELMCDFFTVLYDRIYESGKDKHE